MVASFGVLEEITVASEIAVALEEIAVASEEIAVALKAKHYVYVVLDVAKNVSWEKIDAAVESSLLVLMETSF